MNQMLNSVIRAYAAEIEEVSPGERAVIAVINTGSIDRYNTIIDPAGIDLDEYRGSPVVLWEHGLDPTRGKVPIGKNQWVTYKSGMRAIKAKTIFHDDEFSENLFRLYQNGTLRGYSVNILPTEASAPTAEEIRRNPALRDCSMIYRRSKLAEYSAVAVPGNAEALAVEVSRGLWVPEETRLTLRGITIKGSGGMQGVSDAHDDKKGDAEDGKPNEDDPENEAQHEEPDEDDEPGELRRIKKAGDKWEVTDESGEKVLGKHDSREEAVKQLQAIEANKKSEARGAELPALAGPTFELMLSECVGMVDHRGSVRAETIRAAMDLMYGRV